MLQLRIGLLILILTGTATVSVISAEVVQGLILEDHSGTPLIATAVRLRNGAGAVIKEMDTDRAGRFVIQDLAAGEYQLAVTKSNYVAVNAKITAQPGAASDPTSPVSVVRLIRYGVISGHITSPRRSGSVTAVEQVSEGQIPRSYSATSTATGEFRIFGIPPGRYQLAAAFVGNNNGTGTSRGLAYYPSNTKPREFVIAGGEQYDGIEFVVPPALMSSISGRIVSPAGPQIYTLTMVDSEHPTIRVMIALTAQDGTFRFDNIFPGTYNLYASGPVTPPSYFAQMQLVLNSQNVENMEFRLQPGRPVEFALSTGKTAPNSGCSPDGVITVQGLGSWPLVRDQKITTPISPTAPVRIDNVGPSKFAVTVRSSSGDCVGVTNPILDMTKDVTPERTLVTFQPPGSIHGPATSGNAVVLRDMTPGRESPVQAVFTSSSSEFRFDHLAPGPYCVSTQPATDTIPHWSPESGCANPIINLAPGESKGL